MHGLPHYQHPPQAGTSFTTDEPIVAQRYHPESTVYVSVRFWCCTFCGFGQIYNDIIFKIMINLTYIVVYILNARYYSGCCSFKIKCGFCLREEDRPSGETDVKPNKINCIFTCCNEHVCEEQ